MCAPRGGPSLRGLRRLGGAALSYRRPLQASFVFVPPHLVCAAHRPPPVASWGGVLFSHPPTLDGAYACRLAFGPWRACWPGPEPLRSGLSSWLGWRRDFTWAPSSECLCAGFGLGWSLLGFRERRRRGGGSFLVFVVLSWVVGRPSSPRRLSVSVWWWVTSLGPVCWRWPSALSFLVPSSRSGGWISWLDFVYLSGASEVFGFRSPRLLRSGGGGRS